MASNLTGQVRNISEVTIAVAKGDLSRKITAVSYTHLYGGYVRGILPMTPWFSGYAIAGVTGVQLHRNYPDFNSNNAGFTFGIGTEVTVFGGARVRAEFAQIDQGNNVGYHFTMDQLSVGVSWFL